MKTFLLAALLALTGCATSLEDLRALCNEQVQSYSQAGKSLRIECK